MLKIVFGMLLLMVTALVSAGECIGQIDRIYTHKDGGVAIASSELFGDLNGRHVCNLNATYKDVDPNVCKSWLSQILAAHTAKTDIRLVYVETDCREQGAWASADTPHTLSSWLR